MLRLIKSINRVHVLLIVILLLASVLRLWNLTNYPDGFNADEASLGYNAYSLLQTGKDEYGTSFPLDFKSFGDYKPGLYVYIAMPFIAVMGLNVLAVRLPSALFGIATIIVIYLLGKKVFKNEYIGLLSALLLAISPWHLQYSRGAWETNVATFFIALGVLLFLHGLERPKTLIASGISFLISMYLYQSPRLVVPVLVLALALLYWRRILGFKKQLILIILIPLILTIPLATQFLNGGGVSRFNGLSFLSDTGPISRTDQLVGEHGPNSEFARILHNKVVAYGSSFLGHYLDHFTPDFLFINGDPLIRNKVPETGEFYLVESILLFIAIVGLIKLKKKEIMVLVLWILIAPLASAMTYQTPNALRSLNMVIPLILIMGFGLFNLVQLFKGKWRIIVSSLLCLAFIFETVHYLESYYILYPKAYPLSWEYGFNQMVAKLEQYQGNYNKVVITDTYDQPYILVLFFEQYDPKKYQPQAHLSARDKFNFGTIRSFDKYEFHAITKQEIDSSKDTLFIGTTSEIPSTATIIDKINFPNGQPAFIFAST